ncbi:MAG TPA: hypothetical protein VJ598_05430 [Albitalea sp.]|nr:hypothetical protein [Albitalea sp.]
MIRRVLVLASLFACVLASAAPLTPAIEPATPGTKCVADPDFMRRNHMTLLKHQRDDTVHAGVRGAPFSLKDCVGCHASKASGSVAAAPGDFCSSCHAYAAVKIDCFECHASRPPTVVGSAKP